MRILGNAKSNMSNPKLLRIDLTKTVQIIHTVLCLSLVIVGAIPAYGQIADKILRGGSIVTVNDAMPNAEAVAIKDGKILAVGSNDEIAKHKGAKTR